jgi:hypothetical protein
LSEDNDAFGAWGEELVIGDTDDSDDESTYIKPLLDALKKYPDKQVHSLTREDKIKWKKYKVKIKQPQV